MVSQPPTSKEFKKYDPGRANETAWFRNLALPLASYVNLDSLQNFSKSQFFSRDNNSGFLIELCNLMQECFLKPGA